MQGNKELTLAARMGKYGSVRVHLRGNARVLWNARKEAARGSARDVASGSFQTMAEVNVRVDMGGVHLAFEGSQAFYARLIEPLVTATYQLAARRSVSKQREEATESAAPLGSSREGGTHAVREDVAAAEPANRLRVEDASVATDEGSARLPESANGVASSPAELGVETRNPTNEFVPQAPDRFRQYVMQIGERASTDERRIMAFAFYLWNYEKQERFDAEELRGFFRTLHLPEPDGLSETLADLTTRKRWLEVDADEDELWSLTAKGVNYVKNRLLTGI